MRCTAIPYRRPDHPKRLCRLSLLGKIGVLVFILLIAGCGYQPLHGGTAPKDRFWFIYIPMWENRTNELGLESTIHGALSDWFSGSGHFRVVGRPDLADYILKGTILLSEHPGAAYGNFDQATRLNAVLKTQYIFTRQSGEKLWQANMSRTETYQVGLNPVDTLGYRKKALLTLSDEIAEEIYVRLLTLISSGRLELLQSSAPLTPKVADEAK